VAIVARQHDRPRKQRNTDIVVVIAVVIAVVGMV
jgi:hypothetical protein